MQPPPRLTPDATYQGLLLTKVQYDTHLAMLGRALASQRHLLLASEAEGPWDNHVAWCALAQSRLISDRAEPGWYRVTEYGRVYAAQRGLLVK